MRWAKLNNSSTTSCGAKWIFLSLSPSLSFSHRVPRHFLLLLLLLKSRYKKRERERKFLFINDWKSLLSNKKIREANNMTGNMWRMLINKKLSWEKNERKNVKNCESVRELRGKFDENWEKSEIQRRRLNDEIQKLDFSRPHCAWEASKSPQVMNFPTIFTHLRVSRKEESNETRPFNFFRVQLILIN